MRLFFINWSGKAVGMIEVVKEIQRRHEVVYWTCPNLNLEINKEDFPGTILHEHFDALVGIPAPGISEEEFLPPGEDLLKKLYETESVVLTMMNKRFENLSVSERKRLYIHYVRYWNGILKKYKPDAVIFSAIPHTVYDFVVYSLARLMRIKTIMTESIWINDRIITMQDFKIGSALLLKQSQPENITPDQLSPDLQEYYRLQTIDGMDATPFYVKDTRTAYSGINKARLKFRILIKSLKDGTILTKSFFFLKRYFGENIRKEYFRLQVNPDLTKKFIYVPLHYQPERTTSPQGGVFVDQILMIETLSSVLPKDWVIYVKEHFVQWLFRGSIFFSYRFKGYYKQIARLKNVKLIPVQTDTYDLIKKCQAVATVTGTAGWEALLRSKPALIFGFPWYQSCEGVLRVNDADSADKAITDIGDGFVPSQRGIASFLKALEGASFHGYVDFEGKKISQLTAWDNVHNVATALEAELFSGKG